jgi:hypothetical protein
MTDSNGIERYRIEGYLPQDWFRARLEMGLARVAFMKKKFADAQVIYASVAERFANLALAAEALYWRDVCKYKATNDHTVLEPVAKQLAEEFPGDEWQLKSVPWTHE